MDFYLSISISLWCMGLTVASRKGMLLDGIYSCLSKWVSSRRDFVVSHLEATLTTTRLMSLDQGVVNEIGRLEMRIREERNRLTWRDYVAKPLILCPVCMASFHGAVISLMFVVFDSSSGGVLSTSDVFICIHSIVASCYFNFVLNKFTINFNVEQS